ncbi:nucleotidyltransferase domain-containing protein [Syntrophomonas wolfei]|uniref:nucleotidyltransferase domain-containing protein n=1 Tax=Syntrophomonas wolfei TaxID=863 RepID=UPI00077430D5|nr:nucleotidyltransferase domain-containing protein [Syntrophomonas wolfei]
MVTIPETLRSGVKKYIERLRQEIPVEKALLFGSYARGTYDSGSDIDLAIFSDYFQGMRRVDGIAFLLSRADEIDLDLEPLAFTCDEYREKIGLVDEIIRNGIEI